MSQDYCDVCAGDLGFTYHVRGYQGIFALVYSEHVIVCSGRCLQRLYRLWKPATLVQRVCRFMKRAPQTLHNVARLALSRMLM